MGRKILLRVGAALALAAFVGAGGALAQGDFVESFALEPGASATISFEGFCYQYGEPFPDALSGPSGLAEGNIRAALALARAQGLIGSDQDALQVQYAIWQLQGQDDAPAGGELTRRILNQTRAAPGPSAPQATSLVDALSSGRVTVSVAEFGPVGQPVEIAPGVSDTFYGRGRLEVTNTSQEALTLYMPIGTIIAAADAGDQDLVAYATAVEGGDPPVASEQGGPPAQATAAPAQATAAPTQAPSEVPTQAAQAPTQAPSDAPTQAPTQAAQAPTQAPTQAAQAPTQQASPVAAQPQAQQARSYLEPVNAPGASAGQLPNTSGGGLPLLALGLGALALGAHGARRRLRR